jgi:hypothetical protein
MFSLQFDRRFLRLTPFFLILNLVACSNPSTPDEQYVPPKDKLELRIAALDYRVGDLSDPAVLARYSRADLVIVQCDRFWGKSQNDGDLNLIRAVNPDAKIIGYFRSKVIRTNWGEESQASQSYNRALYEAAKPYWCQTTTGDTLMDWPGAVVFDYTNPAARKALLDVFVEFQANSNNKFDGVYWDYFNEQLWIAPAVDGMEGEPDMDGDGIAHWDDEDERQAFKDAQYEWVKEMRAAMGPGFIQIANGSRALTNPEFAGQFDGMFYELFPNVGYGRGETFRRAMDPGQYNNLWTAREWPLKRNGGPWLILSHASPVGSQQNEEGQWESINAGDLLRAVALLTGATSTHYDNSGAHRAGVPNVEVDLGLPLGPTAIDGDLFTREFERGRVVLRMETGLYPRPFAYSIPQQGVVVDDFGEIEEIP